MSSKKEGKITIANILALTGLAAIGVVTFFGALLRTDDGKPGGAIITAVALVAILALLLFVSIKARRASDNPDKWRIVEYTCVAAYIIVAVVSATPFCHFFRIMSEKDTMQRKARTEIKAIQTMRQNYEHQQRRFLDDATEQLKNYVASGQRQSIGNDYLAAYINEIGTNIDSWAAKADARTKLPDDKQLKELAARVEDWNILDIASLALELEEKDTQAWKDIETMVTKYGDENKLIPVISGGGLYPYDFNGYAKYDLGTPVKARFANALHHSDGLSVTGWILYILMNSLVLLNYLVTQRSYVVGPRRSKNGKSGGLEL